jgi:predicted component of type VI protein secretion system
MAYLIVISDSKEVCRRELTDELVIGRAVECDISLADAKLSRRHCRIESDPADGRWYVVDLNSRNGTMLRGQPVGRQLLQDGDELVIGRITLRFSDAAYVAARPSSPLEDLHLRMAARNTEADTHGPTFVADILGPTSAVTPPPAPAKNVRPAPSPSPARSPAPVAPAATPPKRTAPAPVPRFNDETLHAAEPLPRPAGDDAELQVPEEEPIELPHAAAARRGIRRDSSWLIAVVIAAVLIFGGVALCLLLILR